MGASQNKISLYCDWEKFLKIGTNSFILIKYLTALIVYE